MAVTKFEDRMAIRLIRESFCIRASYGTVTLILPLELLSSKWQDCLHLSLVLGSLLGEPVHQIRTFCNCLFLN